MKASRDQLISEHVAAARRISLRMARRCPDWISRDDLVAAGMVGLTEAAERYDGTRTEPFIAFAEKRIRGAVLDELRRGDIMPRRVRQMARKIGSTIQKLEHAHGATPSDEQVADTLGVTLDTYRANLEQLVHVTVGALDGADEAALPRSPDEATPEDLAAHSEAMATVRRALERLGAVDQRDILILSMHYNDELTYSEIAQVLGVTTSRVCQLHGRAIARLRAEMKQG